jgi:NADP-dependent aldehyde dehydrogenase
VTPTIVSVPAGLLESSGPRLLDESFGPLSVVVQYDDEAQLPALSRHLFPGNLTGGVHALEDESSPELLALINELHLSSGRVLFNGWPTGVAVTPAMQHGGPWPATTTDMGTSVGTAAIGRFLRGVSYQNVPQHLLPMQLRDDNPWSVPQSISPAGVSASWGARH